MKFVPIDLIMPNRVMYKIPFDFFRGHEDQCIINHGQTLERLCSRGGLSSEEAVCIAENKEYYKVKNAKEKLLDFVSEWETENAK